MSNIGTIARQAGNFAKIAAIGLPIYGCALPQGITSFETRVTPPDGVSYEQQKRQKDACFAKVNSQVTGEFIGFAIGSALFPLPSTNHDEAVVNSRTRRYNKCLADDYEWKQG